MTQSPTAMSSLLAEHGLEASTRTSGRTRRPLRWLRPSAAALLLACCASGDPDGFCPTAYHFAGAEVDVTELPEAERVCLDAVCVRVDDRMAVFNDQIRELRVVSLAIFGAGGAELVNVEELRLPLYAGNGFECDDGGYPGGTITVHKDGSITVSEDEEFEY